MIISKKRQYRDTASIREPGRCCREFCDEPVQTLLGVIETSTHTGLRDRALLGVLAYTFARIGGAVNLKVEDYYPSGKNDF